MTSAMQAALNATAGEGNSLIGLEDASPSSSECWRSFGLFQIMVVLPNYNTRDGAWKATAFNADYRAAFQRACMNGKIASYIHGQGASQYACQWVQYRLHVLGLHGRMV